LNRGVLHDSQTRLNTIYLHFKARYLIQEVNNPTAAGFRVYTVIFRSIKGGCEKIEEKQGLSKLMTITELFPTLRNLPRADKLKVMQFLVAELAQEEEPDLQPGTTYAVWSPLNSHEAAHKLAQLLESEQPKA
jgi:hypothetical protein